MPSIDFILPHWVYWSGLMVFPLFAMMMARRRVRRGYSVAIAYLILVTGGILGLHRLYLRNLWGLLYLPVFLAILYCNAQGRDARELQSQAANMVSSAERVVERVAPKVAGADEEIAALRATLAVAEEGSFARIRAEKKLQKAVAALDENKQRLEKKRAELQAARPDLEAATAARDKWSSLGFSALMVIVALMALDALLIPGMVRKAEAGLAADAGSGDARAQRLEEIEREAERRDYSQIGTGWTGVIDRISYFSGEFVAYWSVIAVFAYYFEVLARYVFNSPTIWVHEGMFLMFGMQYLIAGAYAAMTDAHVKVDVFYAEWSPFRKAVVDLLTSVFFFIFAGTILVTGWIFAMDATVVGEVSFSEWKIAYWPFKWAIVVGAALLILQGIAKLARDIDTVRHSLQAR